LPEDVASVAFADRNKVFLGEADRAQWFSVDEARYEITKGRIPIVDAVSQRFQ
jgi:predicted NUDIX family NTP pyrophosphohydrolase